MYLENVTRIPLVADAISRDKFFKLRSHLKVVDDCLVTPAQRKEDRIWKIRPLVDTIRKQCLELPRTSKVSLVQVKLVWMSL